MNPIYNPTPKDILKDTVNKRTLTVKEINVDTIVFTVHETGALIGVNNHYVNNKLIIGHYSIVSAANMPDIKLPKSTLWQKIKSVFKG